ncbi:MAG: hypothetical protein H6703_04510 [Myxococcales bacterium]|nr:hypothetical protein [Myxococcales bacterium]
MQVYAWRGSGGAATPVQKIPDRPWARNEVEMLPATRSAALGAFERLVIPEGVHGPRPFRVGVASDLSPAIGTLHNGLYELSRMETGDRVQLTWVRPGWEELHVVFRTLASGEARTVAHALVERADALRRGGEEIGEGRLAGHGELWNAPHCVFVLLGPRTKRRGGAGGGR